MEAQIACVLQNAPNIFDDAANSKRLHAGKAAMNEEIQAPKKEKTLFLVKAPKMHSRASLISQYFIFLGSRSDIGSRKHSYTGNIYETFGKNVFPTARDISFFPIK